MLYQRKALQLRKHQLKVTSVIGRGAGGEVSTCSGRDATKNKAPSYKSSAEKASTKATTIETGDGEASKAGCETNNIWLW